MLSVLTHLLLCPDLGSLYEACANATATKLLFVDEVTTVARVVGTERKLEGQARVANVGGMWKDPPDSVNPIANNLTLQVRTTAVATIAVARGCLTKKSLVSPFPEKC